jgi:hypothetical protein
VVEIHRSQPAQGANEKLLKFTQCGLARYCGSGCQWRMHRAQCKAAAAARERTKAAATGVEALVKPLRHNRDGSADVLESARLTTAVGIFDSQSIYGINNGVHIVLDVSSLDGLVEGACCGVLACGVDYPNNAAKFCAAGGLQILLPVLRQRCKIAATEELKLACRVVQVVSNVPKNATECSQAGGVETLPCSQQHRL